MMSYTISYGKNPDSAPPRLRFSILTGLFLVLFLLLTWGVWPEGREVLSRMLWPEDGRNAFQAAQVFAEALECGLSLSDAAELFCIQVLSNAGFAG